MALPWALTSGSGVAVALLLGAAGPLIGVAISASLLPPVVNCVSIPVCDLNDRFVWIMFGVDFVRIGHSFRKTD